MFPWWFWSSPPLESWPRGLTQTRPALPRKLRERVLLQARGQPGRSGKGGVADVLAGLVGAGPCGESLMPALCFLIHHEVLGSKPRPAGSGSQESSPPPHPVFPATEPNYSHHPEEQEMEASSQHVALQHRAGSTVSAMHPDLQQTHSQGRCGMEY